jgi:PBP1b-binding outer membrane lipoprotein LpoB
MKKLLFTFLAIAVIFSACKKEEETPANNTATTAAFSCKIDGVDFTDNNPVATIVPPNTLQIVASNGFDEVIIFIFDIDDRTEGEEITYTPTGNRVYVASCPNTTSGELIFSKTGNPVSGTFNAQCNNLQTFQSVTVTEGEFINVAY